MAEVTSGNGCGSAANVDIRVEGLSLGATGRTQGSARIGGFDGLYMARRRQITQHASPDEIELKMTTQMERARAMGLCEHQRQRATPAGEYADDAGPGF